MSDVPMVVTVTEVITNVTVAEPNGATTHVTVRETSGVSLASPLDTTVQAMTVSEGTTVASVVEPSISVVEVGVPGPSGEDGLDGMGILVDDLADRPPTAEEGTMFAARDTDELFIYL